jgi:hypothetical protein
MTKKTILKITDNVNCRFHDLDPVLRKDIVNKLKFMIPYARHMPAFKLGRWDGKVSFATAGGGTYINLLDRVLPLVIDAGYEIEIEDSRPEIDFDFPVIDENFVANKSWPEGHPQAGTPIILRDYQVAAINNYLANPQSVQEISTGAGKCSHYDTLIDIEIDETSEFACSFGAGRQTAKIGDLITSVSVFKQEALLNDREIRTDGIGISIVTPGDALAPVNAVIKKSADGVSLRFVNDHVLRCAKKHILRVSGVDVFAGDLVPGDSIDTIHGPLTVAETVEETGLEYYDVSIPSPHWYIDASGIIHHNTIISAVLSQICEPHGRTLVIVPSQSLVEQTEEDFRNLGLDVGVYFGSRKMLGHQHTIITWQSLGITSKNFKINVDSTILQDLIRDVVCIQIDEAHSAKGEVLKNVLAGPLAHIPIRFGMTGTIPKEEYEWLTLLATIGPIVGEVRAATLQEKGVLANCVVNIMQLRDNDLEFNTYHEEQEYLKSDPKRLDFIARHCIEVTKTGNTLILVNHIETGEALQAAIPGSIFVSGAMKVKSRSKEYKEVATADDKIIIATYGVAAVGINLPRIFNLVLFEAGKSFVRTIQSIGRGLRKAQDKDAVNIYDICSTLKFSSRHLTRRKQFYRDAEYPHKVVKTDIT